MKKLIIPILLSFMLAACETTPDPNTQGSAPVEDHTGSSTGVTTVDSSGVSGSGIAALTDPRSPLSKREIFFDFDSFTIRNEFKPLLEAHARFLVQNPQMKILIQGNTDDRGSREYNLALGQKRADAIKQVLLLLGARESQIESVSLGKEKQRCYESTEECFAQNRRGDILYAGEF